ncbi:hypothetical protein NYE59_23190 [Paenibacillus sp. FSL L8-0323]|uniref:hypothetical protein n=1 Tax=Paenibacillus sp. FSL L8-0323 TaxID=2975330 RepID=UPI0030FB4183
MDNDLKISDLKTWRREIQEKLEELEDETQQAVEEAQCLNQRREILAYLHGTTPSDSPENIAIERKLIVLVEELDDKVGEATGLKKALDSELAASEVILKRISLELKDLGEDEKEVD